MAPQADGTWTAWVELPTAQNWQIAFEGFHPDGVSDISEATDLIAMGVDRVVIESEVVGPLPGKALIPDGSWWLVVAIGSVVAALAGLGYWAFASEPEPADLESSSAPQAEAANGRE
jgi:hypothetical protein